ncbi:MAG: hypothetical protein ABIJ39_02565 [Chloroflexota bacterium]
MTKPPAASATATVPPTRTASPTVRVPTSTTSPLDIRVRDEGVTQLELTEEFLALRRGQYLLYREGAIGENEVNTLQVSYSSIDRQTRGAVLPSGSVESLYRTDPRIPDPWKVSWVRLYHDNPMYYVVQSNDTEQVLVRALDLRDGEMHSWRLIARDGSGCHHIESLSPDGELLPIVCRRGDVSALYLFDPVQGHGRSVLLDFYPCMRYADRFLWLGQWIDADRIWAYCGAGEGGGSYDISGCLAYVMTGEVTCREHADRLKAVSPDGERIILFEEEPGYPDDYYYITDVECLTDEAACQELGRIEQMVAGLGSVFVWNHAGSEIAYSTAWSPTTTNFHTILALVDGENFTLRVVAQGIPGAHYVLGFSPDDQWMLMEGGDVSVTWVSVATGYLHQIADVGFLGWYVVP